ncbi:hypothetical protein T03_5678 [Trichinella britovi]|uniref:Uncharacterized protein n=1 Tax=Trichinella britovi TaxID=45882 RepID=A0A0V1C8W1_TRIBR|nr:hypothetical protein T03_5678 [Trichinella britovi]
MLSNVTHTRIELLNHKARTAFRCQSPASSVFPSAECQLQPDSSFQISLSTL